MRSVYRLALLVAMGIFVVVNPSLRATETDSLFESSAARTKVDTTYGAVTLSGGVKPSAEEAISAAVASKQIERKYLCFTRLR
jgi:hypothetical protein